MKTIFITLSIIAFTTGLNAQTGSNCYQDYRGWGIEQMNRKNYGEAISQFVAGLVTCKDLPANNDLAKLVQEAKETWIKALQVSSERERKAYLEAITAKDLAEKAQTEEKNAREQAVKNAREAYKRGVKAESLRLALMADLVRSRGQFSDAVLLAWMALQMSDDSLPVYGVRAFGEAVRDSFSVDLFNSIASIAHIRLLPSNKRILLETTDHAFYMIGTEPASFTQLPPGIVEVVVANNHDSLLVWEGGANTLRLLGPDGQVIATLKGHTEAIRDAVFSPDDTRIWSAGRDNSIRGWDMNGNQVSILQKHRAAVQELHCLGSDMLVSRASDGEILVWNGQKVDNPLANAGHYFAKGLSVSNSGEHFAVLFSDGTAKLVDVNGQQQKDLGAGVKQVLFAPGKAVLAVRLAMEVNLYNAQGVLLARFPHPARVLNMQFSGDRLITWSSDNIIRLWSGSTEKPVIFTGHRAAILFAQCSPDGENLLSTASDGTVKLWDMQGNILSEWSGNGNSPASAIFSPDGQHILVTSNGGKSLYQAELPMKLYRAISPATVIASPAFSKAATIFGIQFLEVLRRER